MMNTKIDFKETLFLKENKDEELDDMLARVVSFLEFMYRKNSAYPKYLSISKRDYQAICDNRPATIHDGRIMGMQVVVREEKPENESEKRKRKYPRQNDNGKRTSFNSRRSFTKSN